MDETDRYKLGLRTRRDVLGEAYADRVLSQRNEFNADFQDLITRYAWGEVWMRPGLDQRTRRLLVLAMTVALGREEEFKLHLRAGIKHGLAKEEIKEVLLQAALYCGLPAANGAFRAAEDVFAELDQQEST
jgi:4-carboxymuconolactone decarboxylase